MAMSAHPGRLLTPTDLASRLGVPVRTIYAWRSKGEGPTGLRVGKHLRFREGDVDTWIESKLAGA
ncbi:helix-turn-helix transcriptional regulator [Cellulomonas carbonis]|uniref:DNA-binding protein n=1 Tax=Cellulomonas carbonis T26 TaxID=947969 RepID=A0A0A0BUN0_9CELL|nr:helix-turn-helix domain-containing protein [Cellulomonas carbonis]KGM11626.1 DNA-binding protein [Cellulomonas carbonis T26]GGC03145.1 hypothetical protein GCM10010972_15250 [Cellulomonas carbonis]